MLPKPKNKGFTLVELSIVLVIVGLLIGGIIAARSMIESSKLTRFVRETQQYDIVASNFKTKYNAIPGDSPIINGVGNGNGIVEDPGFGQYCTSETTNYWKDLNLVGMVDAKYLDNGDGSCTGAKVSYGHNSVLAVYGETAGVATNSYMVLNLGQLVFTASPGYVDYYDSEKVALNGEQAAAIDAKLDDGVIGTGDVIAWNGSNGSCTYGVPDGTSCLSIIKILPHMGNY